MFGYVRQGSEAKLLPGTRPIPRRTGRIAMSGRMPREKAFPAHVFPEDSEETPERVRDQAPVDAEAKSVRNRPPFGSGTNVWPSLLRDVTPRPERAEVRRNAEYRCLLWARMFPFFFFRSKSYRRRSSDFVAPRSAPLCIGHFGTARRKAVSLQHNDKKRPAGANFPPRPS